MVNINLLPWRAELREKRKKEFQVRSVLAGILGAVAVFAGYMYFSNQLTEQEQVNQMIVTENAQLDEKLKSLEGLDVRRQQILDRMKLIDGLQGQRPVIVRIADELARITPQDLYLTKFQRIGDKFTIEGAARDPNVVAELLRNLEISPWFRNAFMNSYVAASDLAQATNNANPTTPTANQPTSVVQRPEELYGKFVVTVDLDDISKSAEQITPADASVTVNPNRVDAAQPAPTTVAPTPTQPVNPPSASANPPAPTTGQPSVPENATPATNGQAAPATPPDNNQGAK